MNFGRCVGCVYVCAGLHDGRLAMLLLSQVAAVARANNGVERVQQQIWVGKLRFDPLSRQICLVYFDFAWTIVDLGCFVVNFNRRVGCVDVCAGLHGGGPAVLHLSPVAAIARANGGVEKVQHWAFSWAIDSGEWCVYRRRCSSGQIKGVTVGCWQRIWTPANGAADLNELNDGIIVIV
ncbi:hypothetical protein Dimus_018211 [Dionaea muscipula]